jgi:EEF1A N-terminal glycine/lysine methyltransferase
MHASWNAAKCFADYLDENASEFCHGKTVLELGAGGALPSIVCMLNGAKQVTVLKFSVD